MLTSLVLTLTVDAPTPLPRFLGRASHALLLRLLDERAPALAAQLHDAQGPKPFTCSELVGAAPAGQGQLLTPDGAAWLRFTGLAEPVSRWLLALAADPPAQVELDRQTLRVAEATVDAAGHPWAGQITYQALCEEMLSRRVPPRRLALRHVSPTTFRSQGVNIPAPLPYLVFGSLLARWQAFSPVAVSPDALRYAQEMMALARYRLHTQMVRLEERGERVGFVGESEFVLLNRDRYWGNVMALLAAYSDYAGLGGQTGMGMGQTRFLRQRSEG